MFRTTRTLTAVAAALLLSAAGTVAVYAQNEPPPPPMELPEGDVTGAQPPAAAPADEPARDPNTVVAKAGNAEITEGEVLLAEEAFANELTNVPREQWRSVLVDAMINIELMAQGAVDAGLDKGPEFDRRLAFLRLQALRNAYVEHAVVKGVADSALQEAYQNLVVGQHKPEDQVHARHILVDTKEEAEKLIEQLKGGASFEELAKQSKDPSGQNGGDLGFFGPGQMVPAFEKAAYALEPGQFTQEPVESEYGWHIIKVEEKRASEPPSFDEVKDQLRNYVLRQKFEEATNSLRDKYPVEILDPTAMAPAVPEPPAEGEAPVLEESVPDMDVEQPDTPVEEPAMEEPPMEEPATEPAPAN